MTGRELLNHLQVLNEKALSQDIVVSPPSGGYAMIGRVEVLYMGNVVLHLAPTQSEEEALRKHRSRSQTCVAPSIDVTRRQ